MPHHEESPEKPQYNMATPPPILPYPPFPAKNFRPPPPISINFDKVEPPPFTKAGGGGLNYDIGLVMQSKSRT